MIDMLLMTNIRTDCRDNGDREHQRSRPGPHVDRSTFQSVVRAISAIVPDGDTVVSERAQDGLELHLEIIRRLAGVQNNVD